MSESSTTEGRTSVAEKSYPGSRVREEGAARLERRGKLSSTARPVRDGSIGGCLLTKAGLTRTSTKTVTAQTSIKHFLVALCLFMQACYPTVPSGDCAEAISRCLESCESESVDKNDYSAHTESPRVTSTPCQQRCYNRCGGGLVPKAQGTQPVTPSATPTSAAPPPMQTPTPPPVEPLPEPTTEPTSEPPTSF